eukprot:417449-Pyramimonas_sp.AAC.1
MGPQWLSEAIEGSPKVSVAFRGFQIARTSSHGPSEALRRSQKLTEAFRVSQKVSGAVSSSPRLSESSRSSQALRGSQKPSQAFRRFQMPSEVFKSLKGVQKLPEILRSRRRSQTFSQGAGGLCDRQARQSEASSEGVRPAASEAGPSPV